MFTCATCNSQHTEGPFCSVCKQHFDFQCAGVTESGYRKLGERKNTWRCLKCKSGRSPSPLPPAVVPSSQPGQLDSIQEQLNRIFVQLSPLASLVADVKSIKSELSSLKDSIELAHDGVNRLSDKVTTIESRISGVENLATQVPVLQAEIERLNRDLHDRDQRARANNVEIKGIPLKNNENLYDIAQKIGTLCNFSIRKEDINYIARIPTRVPNAVKPIIIAFNCRYMKEELVALARKKKQLSASDLGFSSTTSVYINDHLTQHNKSLLSKARALAKENNFQYIWVKHCKIMGRKSDTAPIFYIQCEKDLQKIIN